MANPFRFLRRHLTASSRAATADVFPHERILGRGQDWTVTAHAEYYAKSAPVYAAIRIRAGALARAPLTANEERSPTEQVPVPRNHPLQRLLDNPNQHMTGTDLVIAIETNLCLWGRAHISIETVKGQVTLWPIRPDRLATIPGAGADYVKGYLYTAETGRQVAYLPEEIVTLAYYNPLQDRTGLSPIAPLRLGIDTALDATRFNRETFRSSGIPSIIIMLAGELTPDQRQAFYSEWEKRFAGASKGHRPALLSGATDIKNLAFSARELQYLEGLRWTLEEVSRVYGVPMPLLSSMQEATLANVQSLERILWRMTLIPEANFIEATINNKLLPRLTWPAHRVKFNLSDIDVLSETEEPRLARETAYLDRGAVTINEVRRSRSLENVPWGNDPDGPGRRIHPLRPENPQVNADAANAIQANGHHA